MTHDAYERRNEAVWRGNVRAQAAVLFIINSALAMGVACFAVIALFVNEFDLSGEPTVLLFVLGFFLASILPIRFVVPAMIDRAGLKGVRDGTVPFVGPSAPMFHERFEEVAPLVAAYHNRSIVASALLEGVAFFAIICYMTERSPIALAIAALLLLGILAQTPTAARMTAYIERGLSKAKAVSAR